MGRSGMRLFDFLCGCRTGKGNSDSAYKAWTLRRRMVRRKSIQKIMEIIIRVYISILKLLF